MSENGVTVNGNRAEGEEDEEDDEEDEEDEEEEDEKFDIDDLSSTESSPPRVMSKLEETMLQPDEARIGKEKVCEELSHRMEKHKCTDDVQAQAEDAARLLTANNPFLQTPHAKSGLESGIETPDRFTGPHPHPPRVSPRHVQFVQSNGSSTGSLASLDPRNGTSAPAPVPIAVRREREEGGRSQSRRTGTSRSRTPRTRDPELEAQKTPRGFDEARMRRAMSRSRSRDAQREREARESQHSRRAFAVWGQDESDSAASDSDA